MKTRNRILSMLAAIGLAIGILSTTVFATESKCGHTNLVWEQVGNQHRRKCADCKLTFDADYHRFGDGIVTTLPDCTNKGVKTYTCGVCGKTDTEEIDANGHDWTAAWASDSNNHWQKCSNCSEVRNMGPHNFEMHQTSDATCVSPALYDKKCNVCDYQLTVTRGDKNPDNHDLVHHDAKTPTCTEKGWNAYDTCSRCDYTTYVELPIDPDNHALTHVKAQAPTCTDHGWDAYDICQRCGYTSFKELPALGHWYSEWTPGEDGTQVATCQRGCGHKAKVKCAEQEYALPMGENEEAYEFTLCPVCGQVSDGTKLALVEKVTAKAVTRWLPAGEPVLRLGTLENGELVLIAGFEYAGQLTQPTGQVQFTLPAEHLKGFTLTVVNADGTEESLDYTTEKDQATFTLDFTDAKTPTILIHLIPEA